MCQSVDHFDRSVMSIDWLDVDFISILSGLLNLGLEYKEPPVDLPLFFCVLDPLIFFVERL